MLVDNHGRCDPSLPVDGLESYNMPLHIAAIFIVFISATCGTLIPVIGKTVPRFKINDYAFLLLKSFGMGVICATGFIHMFIPADHALSNPCLPEWWRRSYDGWAGLIAMLSCLSVQFIQTLAVTHFSRKHSHAHTSDGGGSDGDGGDTGDHEEGGVRCHSHGHNPSSSIMRHHHPHHHNRRQQQPHSHPGQSTETGRNMPSSSILPSTAHLPTNLAPKPRAARSRSPRRRTNLSDDEHHTDDTQHLLAHAAPRTEPLPRNRTVSGAARVRASPFELGAMAVASNIHSDGCCEMEHSLVVDMSGGGGGNSDGDDGSADHAHHHHHHHHDHHHGVVTAYILELGVAMHSLIIGATLGVARGPEFISLLIAVSLHQMFEGVALASTALEAGFADVKQPLLMSLFYTFTTPVGIVLGILISNGYNDESTESLLLVGIFDSISAGILIYDSLVNLLTASITHSRYFSELPTRRQLGVFVAVWAGALAMGLLGIWT